MSVLAECFKIDIGISKQVTLDTMNKSNLEVINMYLESLRNKSAELIDTIADKNSNNNFIEIINVDDHSIFGIIGKSNKVEESVMRRVRNQEGESVQSTNFNWEDYRFFVLHTNTLRCAVIKNSPAPAFQRLFSDFLFKHKTPRISHVNVVPIRDEDIINRFNRFKGLGKIDMIFAKDSSLQKQILSINDIFDISEDSLVKSSITLNLKNQSVPSQLKKFVENNDLIEYEFDKLEFTGINNSDNEETLEFVKKLLTLNVDIDIDYDSLMFSEAYFEQIKQALLESLDNINI